MELLDFKTNLILKTKFDALSSILCTYDVINFWRSLFLTMWKFPRTKKICSSYMCVIL